MIRSFTVALFSIFAFAPFSPSAHATADVNRCADAKAQLEVVQSEFDTKFKAIDAKDLKAQKQWSLVDGLVLSAAVEEATGEFDFCESSSAAALTFAQCRAARATLLETRVTYGNQYLKLDLTRVADQRRWMAMEPALSLSVRKATSALQACERR